MKIQSKCHEILELYRLFSEPGLLDELARRVEEAERKFQAADLDLRLKELDAAKQRQVNPEPVPMDNSHFAKFQIWRHFNSSGLTDSRRHCLER